MAARYAVKSGVWSDITVWDGGVAFPTSADRVRPNGFTVTIDQDITVLELTNDASAPAVANGTFSISSIIGTRTINALIGQRHTTPVVTATYTSGALIINGNILSTTNQFDAAVTIGGSGVRSLTINGNITGTNASVFSPVDGVLELYASSLNTTITGTLTGGSGSGSGAKPAVVFSGTGATLIVNGNLYGGASSGSGFSGGIKTETTAGTPTSLTINGNCEAFNIQPALQIGTATLVTVTGNVTGSSGNAYGIEAIGPIGGLLTVTGTVTAGNAAGVGGASGAQDIDLHGPVIASTNANGVFFTGNSGFVRVRGPLTDASNGRQAIIAPRRILHAAPAVSEWTVRDDSGFPTAGPAMVLTNIGVGMPDPSDVDAGIIYGPNDEFIGTMPVAYPSPADVWNYAISAADEPNSMGIRLRDAATVESTGAQLAAALGE